MKELLDIGLDVVPAFIAGLLLLTTAEFLAYLKKFEFLYTKIQ